MKERWTVLLVLPVLLAGCAGTGPAGSGAPASPPPEQVQAEVRAGRPEAEPAPPELEAAQTESQPRPLTREEVLEAYDRAARAYGWFVRAPLSCGEESRMVDGRRYYQVDYPGFTDLDGLRAYLRELFAPELIQRLLDGGEGGPVYVEVEGALYAAPIRRARDPLRGAAETEVVQNDDGTFSVNVTVELLNESRDAVEGVECSTFPYELVDGRWVFTEFHLVD